MSATVRVIGSVLWRLRYELLCVLVVAAVMTWLVNALPRSPGCDCEIGCCGPVSR